MLYTVGMPSSDEFSRSLESLAERVRTAPIERSPGSPDTPSAERSAAELSRIREELSSLYKSESAPRTLSSPTSPSRGGDYLSSVSPAYRDQVSSLINRAVSDGILSAVSEVQKSKDAYLIDSFHDAFAQFLHSKMHDAHLL